MTTAAPSTALATIQPAFTDPERLALAGFLAGYRGLTREAYALDLRQFTTWCRARSLPLFAVRRADIESFARELESRGRARATITRRLCTIAGFYKYAGRRRAPRAFPGRSCPPSAARLRVTRDGAGPQRARRAAGRRRARPACRACADLAAGAERAAGLRSYRQRHRAPGPGARAPDADDHPQDTPGLNLSNRARSGLFAMTSCQGTLTRPAGQVPDSPGYPRSRKPVERSRSRFGLRGLGTVGPCGGFVVLASGFQASVQDADQAAGDAAHRVVVAGVMRSQLVVVGAGSG